MDKETLINQIRGLQADINTLRSRERTHIKVNTLTEQIEKSRAQVIPQETYLEEIKAKVKELKASKAKSLAKTTKKMTAAITKLLPHGEASLSIEDGAFCLSWGDTPYGGLSGGEKASFDLALTNALLGASKNKVILGEVAEVDAENLSRLLDRTCQEWKNIDAQIILFTCYPPATQYVPVDWSVTQL